jgi:hypothetical protein
MKKFGLTIIGYLTVLTLQAQIIDPLNNTELGDYTTTLMLDNSSGAGEGISFGEASGSLTASYVGTGTSAEQALLLAPTSAFSTVFTVGDMLSVNVNTPASTTIEDFGLAVSTATPTAAGSGNGFNSRAAFDWESISVRPSQSSIRVNTSISGTLTTGSNVAGVGSTANISELFINWVSADVFQLGYVSNNVAVVDATATFAPSSTIGTSIGFYADLRATGTSLGSFSNLAISPIPVPEPSIIALCGMGVISSVFMLRRKK